MFHRTTGSSGFRPAWRGLRAVLRLAACGLVLAAGAASAQVPPPAKLSLDAVLNRVISTDRTVAVADYEVRKAVLERLRAWTRIAPRLSMDGNANWQGSQTRSIAEVPSGSTGQSFSTASNGTAETVQTVVPDIVRERRWTRSHSNAQSLGLNLSQPIIDLTVRPARRQSELVAQIAKWQLRQRLREVMFEVTSQYFEVLRQTQLVEENKKTLGQTTEQVRQAEGRLAAQEVIESDVLQARVSDEQARRAVMEAEVSRDLAMARLAVMLDYLPDASFALSPVPAGKLAAAGIGQAIQTARQYREEVRVAELTLNRTQAERDEIMARFAPTMDLQFGGDLNIGSTLDRRDSWSAGVSFSWALFDRGQRELDLKANGLQQTQDSLRIENSVRVISNDVLDAWFTVDRYRKRLTSLAIERKAAEANYDVQQGKYKAGLATALEVQTALRDLARVRIEHASSTYTLEVAYRDLENVIALYESPRIEAATRRLSSPLPQTPVTTEPK